MLVIIFKVGYCTLSAGFLMFSNVTRETPKPFRVLPDQKNLPDRNFFTSALLAARSALISDG